MPKRQKKGDQRSPAADRLAMECRAARIPVVREVMFHPTRLWRFDFVLNLLGHDEKHLRHLAREGGLPMECRISVEVDGGSQLVRYSHKQGKRVVVGGHQRAADFEKMNEAVFLGWRCYRFTPSMVKKGTAISVLMRELDERREIQERGSRDGVVVQGGK